MRFAYKLPHPLIMLTFLVAVGTYQYLMWPLFMVNDVPRHLAAGDYILAHGIPKTDPWSFTAGDTPWYNLAWGWDVLLSLGISHLGMFLTRSIIILIPAFAMALLVRNLIRRGNASEEVVILTILAAGMGLNDFISARPQTLAYLFIILFHSVLHESRGSGRYGTLMILPMLTVLWVNLHGSILVGITLLGAYGLEAIVKKEWVWLKRLLAISFTCVAAAMLNPYGWHVIPAILHTMTTVTRHYINEWQPFHLDGSAASFWMLLFFFLTNFKDEGVSFADRVITFIWLLAALLSGRNISIFIIVAAPYLVYHMHQLAYRFSRVTRAKPRVPEYPPRTVMAVATTSVFVSFCLLFTPVAYLLKTHEEMNYRVRVADSVAFITSHYPQKRFLNAYELGSYLIYESKGVLPVFIDDRAETAYPEQVITDYFHFMLAKPGWEHVLSTYRIDGIILPVADAWKDFIRVHKLDKIGEIAFTGEDTMVYLLHAQHGNESMNEK